MPIDLSIVSVNPEAEEKYREKCQQRERGKNTLTSLGRISQVNWKWDIKGRQWKQDFFKGSLFVKYSIEYFHWSMLFVEFCVVSHQIVVIIIIIIIYFTSA